MLRATFYSAIFLSLSSAYAAADEYKAKRPQTQDNGWSVYVGGGGVVAPNYSGDDDYMIMAIPFIRVTKGERFFASMQEGVGYRALNKRGFKAGPLLSLDMGREQESGPFQLAGNDRIDLIGFEDINPTVALGGFAEYKLGKVNIKSKAGKALGSHKGFSGEISAEYESRITDFGRPLMIGVGPKVKFADSKYTQAFYGVTPEQSGPTDLTAFQADGGIVSYGIGASVMTRLSKKSSLRVFGSFDKLAGDAANSPLVIERGSTDQLFAGALLAYKF